MSATQVLSRALLLVGFCVAMPAAADEEGERAVRDAVAVAKQLRQSDNEFDQIAGA